MSWFVAGGNVLQRFAEASQPNHRIRHCHVGIKIPKLTLSFSCVGSSKAVTDIVPFSPIRRAAPERSGATACAPAEASAAVTPTREPLPRIAEVPEPPPRVVSPLRRDARPNGSQVSSASSRGETLLAIDQLHKRFGKVHALRGVSFDLVRGQRLAFLGPNGAGKTTLIRCLAGRCRPDQGSIRIRDDRGQFVDLRKASRGAAFRTQATRGGIGVVPQEIAVYGDLTTRENLRAFGRYHGLTGKRLQRRVQWALLWTGLADRADQLTGGFSGGMKRRVNIACGVLHEPDILLLDEPTVGVDPQSRHKIFEMLDELSARGTSIVLTTHHLDEAQSRSDRIVIIDHGQIVADGPYDELVQATVGKERIVRMRLDRPLAEPIAMRNEDASNASVPGLPPSVTRSMGHSGSMSHSGSMGRSGDDAIVARVDRVAESLPRLMHAIRTGGYEVCDVDVSAPTLHDVFLHLTGHELRDE